MTFRKIAVIVGIVSVYTFIAFALTRNSEPQAEKINETLPVETVVEEVGMVYPFGIRSADTLHQKSAKIKRNETFYTVMRKFGVTPAEIKEIVSKTRDDVNLQTLQIGQPYHIFYKLDSLENQKPHFFILEESVRDYASISLMDSIYVAKGVRPSEYFESVIGGVITSSLYESFLDLDEDPNLAFRLSDMFAWQIDFYRIQKGDEFRMVMEKEYIDDKPTGDVIIKAVYFKHKNETYYAFRYQDKYRILTLDENGNSLQKTFLRAPVRYTSVSSRYTKRRYHPVLKEFKAHLGTDYAAPRGTPVYATADGIVLAASHTGYNGNYVKIRHNGTYKTAYLHLSKIASQVKKGVSVKQGQIIGYVGSTGLATGDHVCYRFWKNDIQLDPFKQFNPPAQPIETELKEQFYTYMMPLKHLLDNFESKKKNSSDNEPLALF